MLPRIHPLTKTSTDLKRCEARVEDFISRFPSESTNEVERYLKLLDLIQKAKDLIPDDFND